MNGPNTKTGGVTIDEIEGPGTVEYRIKALPLLRGLYTLSAAVYDEHALHAYDHHDRLYPFHVQQRVIRENAGMIWIDADWAHAAGASSAQPSTATIPFVGTPS